MNSKKNRIMPVYAVKLDKVAALYTILVDTDDGLYTPIYETASNGLAELVFEDIARQMADGDRLLRVCEPENSRMVELTMDQVDYLMSLVEADEGKHEDNTEGDYHLRQMQEQTTKVLGRYF